MPCTKFQNDLDKFEDFEIFVHSCAQRKNGSSSHCKNRYFASSRPKHNKQFHQKILARTREPMNNFHLQVKREPNKMATLCNGEYNQLIVVLKEQSEQVESILH